MAKVKEYPDNRLCFLCPGCDMPHALRHGGTGWQWNGSIDKPTFSPSIKVSTPDRVHCHSFITDGMIKFCEDSPVLPGQTVELPEWDSKWD